MRNLLTNQAAVLMRSLAFMLVLSMAACGSAEDNPSDGGSSDTTSTVTKEKRFSLLSPAETGISFANQINEVTTLHYYVYGYLYNGGGVAVGDINQDGLPDLYFSGTMVPNRLYLNKGDLRFEDITESAGLAETQQALKTGVAMADINADGLLDIFVSRSGSLKYELRKNLVYLNNGDQTFTESADQLGLGDPCNTNQAAFFDMDGDGDLDCYMMNHPTRFGKNSRPRLTPTQTGYERITTPETDYESDRLYRNNGNGTFTDVSKAAGIDNSAFGLSLTVADFNEDGHPDIFVANDFVEPDFLYINDGKGRFTDRYGDYFRHISQNSMGSDFADLNNDGHDDLMVLDMLPDDPVRQKAMMSTMMLDRYNTLLEYGYGRQQMRNVLQANNGDGTFSEIGQMAGLHASDWSWAPVIADLDNDGLKDIYITNGYMRDVTDLDFLKFKNDSLRKALTLEDLPTVLAKIPQSKLRNHLYHNEGGFSFNEVGSSWGATQPTFSNGAVAADLDGDGDLELITNNISDAASIYRNDSPKQNALQLSLQGVGKNPFAVGATVVVKNGQQLQRQYLNPVRGYFSSTDHVLHFGLGSAASAEAVYVKWPNGVTEQFDGLTAGKHSLKPGEGAKVDDLPGGTKTSTANPMADAIDFTHVENDFEDFKREFLLPKRLSREGPCMVQGDANGDGRTDLFIGGAAGQAGQVYLQSATGNFGETISLPNAECEDVAATFFDANGDGALDLYVVSGGYAFADGDRRYADRLYLWQNGTYVAANLPVGNSPGNAVAAGDFDKDGDLDLFVGGFAKPGSYPAATRSYLLQNDGSSFTDITEGVAASLLDAGIVSDVRWADTDKDGQMELLVCGEWETISTWEYDGSQFKAVDNGLANETGWWNSLTLFDADKDGDLDILAGNLGHNSRFTASASEPLTLYATDFDGNGSTDPVLFKYENGQLRPWASLDLLLSQLPGLKKSFIRYNKYARADVSQIFTNAQLQSAEKFTCNTLENSLYLNDGQGRFTKASLPALVQAFPVRDAEVGDFNADGAADLVLVGNNYHMDIETGPITAGQGLVLEGNGQGGFTIASSKGLAAIGDARAVEIIRLDGENSMLVVGMNGGKTATFAW